MQISPRLLGLIALPAVVALGQAPTAADERYLASRKEYERRFGLPFPKDSEPLTTHKRALADLENQLRLLIGPVSLKGADSGSINIESLFSGEEGSGNADGLLFTNKAADWRVMVTTTGVFRVWSTAMLKAFRSQAEGIDKALNDDNILTRAIWDDTHVNIYAAIPVASASRHVASAFLMRRGQDDCFPCAPDRTIAGVVHRGRVYVVEAHVRDTIPVPRSCVEGVRAEEATKYTASRSFDWATADSAAKAAQVALDRKAEAEHLNGFQRCYSSAARKDARFQRIVARVSELVESLP